MINCQPLARKLFIGTERKLAALAKKPQVVMLSIGSLEPRYRLPHKHAQAVAERLKIGWKVRELPYDSGTAEVLDAINALNLDGSVNGIVLHRPFPKPLSLHLLHQAVSLTKDVEGMHPSSLGKLVFNSGQEDRAAQFEPCTAKAALHTVKYGLDQLGINSLEGLEVLVVGHSSILARPVCSYLHAAGLLSLILVCVNSK